MPGCRRRWPAAGRASSRAAPPRSPRCRSSSSCVTSRATSRTTRWPISTSTWRSGRQRCSLPAARCTGAPPPRRRATRCWRSAAPSNARTVTKGKSMISEELGINDHLERHGITPVETDLGEYIIQLRHELPSHIIAPAFHLNREDWEESFRKSHTDLPPDRVFHERRDILTEARAKLREKFLAADVGITGANFLIAETGSSVIVTNEGNGDLTQTLPRVHIVLASIEKIVPTHRGLHLAAAGAGALRDRAGFLGLHHVLHRRAAAGRSGRAGGIPRRAGRQRPLGDARHRVPGDAALHPLRRVHEPLPGLWRGRRARLWLGVSRPDGRRADPVADRRATRPAICRTPPRSAASARASAR